jgi:hypothetical protein
MNFVDCESAPGRCPKLPHSKPLFALSQAYVSAEKWSAYHRRKGQARLPEIDGGNEFGLD